MAEIVNRQVNIYISSGEAQKAYDTLIKKEKQLNEEIAKTTDPKRMKKLKDDLAALSEPIDRAGKKMRGELLPTFKDLEATTRKFLNEWKKTGDPAVLANFKKANTELQAMKQQMNGLEEAQKGLDKKGIFSATFWAGLAGGLVTKAGSAISSFFSDSIKEALNADEATTRLQSTLDNLGRGDAFDRISRKAQQMADKFRYLDNDDVTAVFNKLIDYGRLTEKQMDDLVPVIINFAAKTGQNLGDATDVIVKALGGSGKALKQFGIELKEGGTNAENYAKIMGVVKEKTDGAADAFQNSAKGSIAVAIQQFKNLKEEVGNNLLPILIKLLNVANAIIKPLSFILSGRSPLSEIQKGLFSNPVVQQGAVEQEKAFQKALDNNLALAKKFNKDQDKITEEFIAKLRQRKAIIDKELPGLTAGLAFGGKQKDKTLDLASESIAIQNLLDKLTQTSKALGIADITDKKNTEEKKNDVKKLIDFWEEYYKVRANGEEAIAALIDKRRPQNSFEKDLTKEDAFIKANIDAVNSVLGNDPQIAIAQNREKRIAEIELRILTEKGRKKLNAELELLNQQEAEELRAKNLTEQRKAEIEERYRQKREELETNYWVNLVEKIAGYINQVLDIYSIFAQAQTNREDQELRRYEAAEGRKEKILQDRLRRGLITQKEYDRQIGTLQSEKEKKEREIQLRQFERQRRISIVQALINGAEGATKTIAKNGFPAAIPLLILEAAKIAAEIGLINSQEPKFAQGGVLGGRTHAQGGNAVVDGSGKKIAEIEHGEGIINRRSMADGKVYNATGTVSQIASMLNGMNGVQWAPGGSLQPLWYSRRPAAFNYSAIKKYYADGGVFGATSSAGAGAGGVNSGIMDMLQQMNQVNTALYNQLRKGIVAIASLKQFNLEQQRLNDILADATMR